MVTIATFNEPAKARQLKRRFEDEGLKVDVHNEAPVTGVRFHVQAAGERESHGRRQRFREGAKSYDRMGSDRSGYLRGPDSLPAMQLFKYRISADDAEIFDARARWRALRTQNNSERNFTARIAILPGQTGNSPRLDGFGIDSFLEAKPNRARTLPQPLPAANPLLTATCHSERSA